MPRLGVDVVRSDGGLAHLRPADDSDRASLLALFERCSGRSLYYRFFSSNRPAILQSVDRLVGTSAADGRVLLATVGGTLTGVAEYDVVNPTTAEFAVMVDDHDQHQGIGTLLLEHLAAAARQNGIRWFVADVLAENVLMTRVIRTLGLSARWEDAGSVSHVTIDLEPNEGTVAIVDERERTADAASLRSVLYPRSVAVIGAS